MKDSLIKYVLVGTIGMLSVISAGSVQASGPVISANKVTLDYFLPKDLPAGASYASSITKPNNHLGFEVGQWHARYDQVTSYMQLLAAQSDRVSVIEMGRSNEQRPQLLVVISSPENQAKLAEIIAERSKEPAEQKADSPLVVWLGYSVHGNEASGTNTSLLTAYHLTALESEQHQQFLKETVVLIEPSLNPDGYGRFSTWVNSNKSQNMSGDAMDREHREAWPNGRTNHYRFDLNRDWLLLTHKESRARLAWFHQFKPHVLGDYHEMRSHRTYFFQPGVPERQNPLTPEQNFSLTDQIARYHAKALDDVGTLYYSKQGFDDYYYGKGSTYPDINGSVGILFEQASARGHLIHNEQHSVSFPYAVRNQFITSLSTLKGAYELRNKLKDYQQDFYNGAANEARSDANRAVVFSDDGDKARAEAFIDILKRHRIKVYHLGERFKGKKLSLESGYIVPYNQSQYRLIKAIFETRTKFKDNTFYDVSTWTMPHAFNLPFTSVSRSQWRSSLLGSEVQLTKTNDALEVAKPKVAYAIDWNNYQAPSMVNGLLEHGILVRMAKKSFTAQTSDGKTDFSAGSIIIPLAIQGKSSAVVHQIISKLAKQKAIAVKAINSGYALRGIDLGSPSMIGVQKPKPLMLTGNGISGYETGEIWHLLDTHLELPVVQAKIAEFGRFNLSQYSHLIMANGNYRALSSASIDKIKAWINSGGVLVATKSAAKWAADNKLIDVEFEEYKAQENIVPKDYYHLEYDNAQKVIGGSIFETRVDITHPLAFGYQRNFLPTFRNHTLVMKPSKNPYASIVRYVKQPLLSGFVSDENLQKIADSTMMVAERSGKGSVILILDNPVFRGYWYGTSRLLINSLYFGTAFENPAS